MSNKFVERKYGSLTDSQREGLDRLKTWYKSKDSKDLIFTLSGAAGTGKTYLLKYFLEGNVRQSVCPTAPTHKALRVIEKMINKKGKTLQSLHGLRPNFNLETFDINQIKFQSLGNIYIANYNLVIVDECSQVSRALRDLNDQRAKQYNTKILYVGDKYQLPPVGEDHSSTFDYPNKFELTEIVRQDKDNPLLDLLSVAREDVKNNTNKFLHYLHNKRADINRDKDVGYIVLSKENFSKELIKYMSSDEFLDDVDYARYTAWTNGNIITWNNFIRNETLDSPDKIVTIDDLFTGYRTIIDEFGNTNIVNSEDYIVSNIIERDSEYGFKSFYLTLNPIYDRRREINISIVDHQDVSFMKYYNELKRLRSRAIYSDFADRARRWKEFYRFKDTHLNIVKFDITNNGNSTTSVNKDIDYGYGLTTHKLQGSTIGNIFINLLDMCYYKGDRRYPFKTIDRIKLRNRLVYTALSRASHKAIILL